MYEFKCLRILTCWFFIGGLVDVKVFVSLQLHHKSLGCHFRRFNVFRIVMILFGPAKCLEQGLKCLFLSVGNSGGVHFFQFLGWDVVDVFIYKLFWLIDSYNTTTLIATTSSQSIKSSVLKFLQRLLMLIQDNWKMFEV